MLRATPQAVRRLAIRNQRLDGPLPRRKATPQDLLETVRALRCLQLDPTAVVARNHLLVLFSRHGAFDERAFEQLAYEDRALFEYWAHEASYVLSEDLPLHAWEMRHWPHGRGGAWQRRVNAWYGSEVGLREHILEVLTEAGPSRATAFEDRATVAWESGGWTTGRNVSRMLDMMWVRGVVGISRREGAQRVWDLMERCLPAEAPREPIEGREITRRAAPLAIKALGAARVPHIRAHFTRGRYPDLPEVLAELHREGVIEPLAVEGLGEDWWICAEDVERLNDDFKGRTVLLSPFDNLLCDRARTEALFGFHHRLEIYVPRPKRRWGYFVLPILDGDRLVGRVDLAMDRKRDTLVAHTVHAEPKVPRGARLPKAIRRELERLAAWRGAANLEIHAAPEAWRSTFA
ncbi:YcaQ family DNA glycosylase [Solirubrobacter sp. CPCC 204708]|uniref:Winged helix DNA-binding domain-containing protein n=1 Tax=Solirubrobacter deserti TaxID=2282478 RepID=A0ABT4RL96_9ACTN|nr:crosslink repair DNA glycosylase YcaQ family protein [Solirubrobacter deserti]MBE2318963.1 YcaQ family DNA glycosylase [Solirubrobacter deserti]MDA0139312.1 winged helix DNA-binding domain-containing protein [Solirubrobacter deserti]